MIDSILGIFKGVVDFAVNIFKRNNDPDIIARKQAEQDQKTDDKVDAALKEGNEDDLRNSVG